jgi:hypothetical protein
MSKKKPIAIFGGNYPSITAAAKAKGVTRSRLRAALKRYGGDIPTVERKIEASPEGRPAHKPKPISISILGGVYASLSMASKAIGLKRTSLNAVLKRCRGDTTAAEKEIEAFLQRDKAPSNWKRITFRGNAYASLTIFHKRVVGDLVSLSHLQAMKVDDIANYVETKMRERKRLTLNGKVYKGPRDFAREHGLDEASISFLFWSNNEPTLEQIARHHQIPINSKPERDPVRVHKGIPVLMSGWRWASRSAFCTYYGIVRLNLNDVANFPDAIGKAILPHLTQLHMWKDLRIDNRLVNEAEVPVWAMPLNVNAREEATSDGDRHITPDWSPEGLRWMQNAQEPPEIVKTARRALLATTPNITEPEGQSLAIATT